MIDTGERTAVRGVTWRASDGHRWKYAQSRKRGPGQLPSTGHTRPFPQRAVPVRGHEGVRDRNGPLPVLDRNGPPPVLRSGSVSRLAWTLCMPPPWRPCGNHVIPTADQTARHAALTPSVRDASRRRQYHHGRRQRAVKGGVRHGRGAVAYTATRCLKLPA